MDSIPPVEMENERLRSFFGVLCSLMARMQNCLHLGRIIRLAGLDGTIWKVSDDRETSTMGLWNWGGQEGGFNMWMRIRGKVAHAPGIVLGLKGW